MAKVIKSKKVQVTEKFHFSFTNRNYMIIGIGIVLIIIGYVFMSENSVDGFLPTVVAPILLVLGYIVVVPIGILYRDKNIKNPNTDVKEQAGTKNVKVS
ncbi:MAG: hypothetical protein MUE56_09120 [Ignavibacteria bacterium]|jgi:NAD/NADP transhydrogenase beta subunit|nr:hypothetical protein [Ignavibacteria bacterium]